MSFQLRENDTRIKQYPYAQDLNFLGYDREADRWKVDASGTWSDPSGVRVLSASGTYTLPTYIEGARFDDRGNQFVIRADNLVPKEYDYISLGYSGDNVTSVVYKSGGASGTTVATLALTYNGSNVSTVTRT